MKDYTDMLHLPHHVSQKRAPMSRIDRAAQFSPFAALTGYEQTLQETARQTQPFRELTESEKEMLNEKLLQILARIDCCPEVTVTFFQPDLRKDGGAYVTKTGNVKKVDSMNRNLWLADGTGIPIPLIYELESPFFESFVSV